MLAKRILGTLVLAALVASCGGGGGHSTPTSPATPGANVIVVQIQDDQYSPKDVTINPGDTVRWVMAGTHQGHTVTSTDGSFDSGAVFNQTGAIFEHTFTAGGKTFEYQCKTHYNCCGMAGAIRVGSNAPDPHPGY